MLFQSLTNRLYLRFAPRFASLKKFPGLRHILESTSSLLLKRDALVWAKIQSGPAAGLWIQVSPRVGNVFLEGKVERDIQRVFMEKLGPSMTVYDLGANFGLFSLLAARKVGPQGKVFSFEPELKLTSRIQANAEKNSFANIQIVRAAVWSSTGHVSFAPADPHISPDLGTGQVNLADPREDRSNVPSIALDDFVRENPPPDLIKCDVEGSESEVLQGAEKLFSSARPWFICEVHDARNAEFLIRWLTSKNYTLEWVEEPGRFPRHLIAHSVEST
jgi:FkbM family methyltransferase